MQKRTFVIGAGEAGKMVAAEILDNSRINDKYKLVGFLDDQEKSSVLGYPVFSPISKVSFYIESENVDLLIIAIPSADEQQINRIIDSVAELPVQIKIVPGIEEIIQGNVYWRQVRNVRPTDLLGREEVFFKKDILNEFYSGKTVLVTGGGGSIGSEICRQLLHLSVKKVVALGHGENSIFKLGCELQDEPRLVTVIGDVTNSDVIKNIIVEQGVDTIFHAAAHKHVPLMERFPIEAYRNNVLGTVSVATAAHEADVENFLLVSTDKAVKPTSVMGATKRISEKMVLSLDRVSMTNFMVTRFGNVLGSRGSVLPLFQRQIEAGGPVTVTDKKIERYFMSIREAARLVIQAVSLQEGHLFILDMGRPIKIYEFAQKLIRLSGFSLDEIGIKLTGLRPGEKMYEELMHDKDDLIDSKFSKLFISQAKNSFFAENELEELLRLATKFVENLDEDEIKKLLFKYAT